MHKFPDVMEPAVNGKVEILHEDEALIVLNKPAPLPMHAGGRFNRNTLHYILSKVYHPERPRQAHRSLAAAVQFSASRIYSSPDIV